MRLLIPALLMVCAAALPGQDFSFSGTLDDDQERYYLLDIDFGSTPQSITLDVTAAATAGNSGLDVSIVDLDEMALNGSANATAGDWDTGTGPLNMSLVSASYSGVHQFVIVVQTDSGNGPSTFSGSLTASAGIVNEARVQTVRIRLDGKLQRLMTRGMRMFAESSGALSVNREFRVDFGSTPQAVTFFAQAVAFGDAEMEFFEVDETGAEQSLGIQSGTAFWSDEQNYTTSSRSGIVRFRVKVNATSTSQGAYIWQCVFPGTVSVLSTQSSGGSSKSDGGCSTDGNSGLAMGLALLVLAWLAWRRRLGHARNGA